MKINPCCKEYMAQHGIMKNNLKLTFISRKRQSAVIIDVWVKNLICSPYRLKELLFFTRKGHWTNKFLKSVVQHRWIVMDGQLESSSAFYNVLHTTSCQPEVDSSFKTCSPQPCHVSNFFCCSSLNMSTSFKVARSSVNYQKQVHKGGISTSAGDNTSCKGFS